MLADIDASFEPLISQGLRDAGLDLPADLKPANYGDTERMVQLFTCVDDAKRWLQRRFDRQSSGAAAEAG